MFECRAFSCLFCLIVLVTLDTICLLVDPTARHDGGPVLCGEVVPLVMNNMIVQ